MMDYLETIKELIIYCQSRFSDPEEGWSENRITARSFEQAFSDIIISDCLENATQDPYEIIFCKALHYDYVLGRLDDSSLMIDAYKCAERTSHILLSFLNSKENK